MDYLVAKGVPAERITAWRAGRAARSARTGPRPARAATGACTSWSARADRSSSARRPAAEAGEPRPPARARGPARFRPDRSRAGAARSGADGCSRCTSTAGNLSRASSTSRRIWWIIPISNASSSARRIVVGGAPALLRRVAHHHHRPRHARLRGERLQHRRAAGQPTVHQERAADVHRGEGAGHRGRRHQRLAGDGLVVEDARLAPGQVGGDHQEAHRRGRMRSRSSEASISSRSGPGSKSEPARSRVSSVSQPGSRPAKNTRARSE